MEKKQARLRRARKTRARIAGQGMHRLSVHRTPRHIYAQIFTPDNGAVIASASTLDKEIRKEVTYGGNVAAAKVVGRIIADRAKGVGVDKVAFDRSGFKFHGRVRALAEAARERGLEF
jgi:large subunit ribosomal protein L18